MKPCLFLKNAKGTAALGGWPINLCCFVILFKLKISQIVQRDLALQENLLMPSRSKAELAAKSWGCTAWGAAAHASGDWKRVPGASCLGGLMGAPRFANRICGWPGFAALCWIRANILYSSLCLSKWNFRVFPVIAEIYIADISCNKLYLSDCWLWKKSFELKSLQIHCAKNIC